MASASAIFGWCGVVAVVIVSMFRGFVASSGLRADGMVRSWCCDSADGSVMPVYVLLQPLCAGVAFVTAVRSFVWCPIMFVSLLEQVRCQTWWSSFGCNGV